MLYILWYRRYYVNKSLSFATLKEAILKAVKIIADGEAWPGRIEHEGIVLWEQSGPFTTYQNLITFATQQGFHLHEDEDV